MGGAEAIWGGRQQSICCIANIRNVHVLRAGRICPFHHHRCVLMGVVGEGVQGVLVANKKGGEKVSMVVVRIGSQG